MRDKQKLHDAQCGGGGENEITIERMMKKNIEWTTSIVEHCNEREKILHTAHAAEHQQRNKRSTTTTIEINVITQCWTTRCTSTE